MLGKEHPNHLFIVSLSRLLERLLYTCFYYCIQSTLYDIHLLVLYKPLPKMLFSGLVLCIDKWGHVCIYYIYRDCEGLSSFLTLREDRQASFTQGSESTWLRRNRFYCFSRSKAAEPIKRITCFRSWVAKKYCLGGCASWLSLSLLEREMQDWVSWCGLSNGFFVSQAEVTDNIVCSVSCSQSPEFGLPINVSCKCVSLWADNQNGTYIHSSNDIEFLWLGEASCSC